MPTKTPEWAWRTLQGSAFGMQVELNSYFTTAERLMGSTLNSCGFRVVSDAESQIERGSHWREESQSACISDSSSPSKTYYLFRNTGFRVVFDTEGE